jgi:hypothetical protein
MFSLRRRPRGLEVPGCEACNRATRQHEQVAALFGRIFPDGRTAEERDELQRIMRAVNSNNPGLLEEMIPSRRQKALFTQSINLLPLRAPSVLNCSGPMVNRSMQIFGAKLGFALHYARTGRIIPLTGGVAVRWYSNYDAVTGEIPANIYDMLGPPRTLRQGQWHAGDQFSLAMPMRSLNIPKWLPTFQYFASPSRCSRGSAIPLMVLRRWRISKFIGLGRSLWPEQPALAYPLTAPAVRPETIAR